MSPPPAILDLRTRTFRADNRLLRSLPRQPSPNGTCTVTLVRTCTSLNIAGLICSLGCPQRKITKIYGPIIEGATHSTFSDTLQHPRQLRQQISGVQQQDLVASQCCKNLGARCFKEGTGNDVRKYIIRSRLSNVSDSHVKFF